MSKPNKIIYWISTAWLALGMLSTGLVQLMHMKSETDFIIQLGYPDYFLSIIGIAKIIGTAIVLLPKLPLLKEWTYAGFVFMMSGAIASHISMQNTITDIFPALLLLSLSLISWYFRPVDRKTTLQRIAADERR